jgi:hypothetical protein
MALYLAPEMFAKFAKFAVFPFPGALRGALRHQMRIMPSAVQRGSTMRIFEDDAGYLAWVESHQHGFVVNTFRKPDPRYLILHRATCGTITSKPARGDRWTTGDFIKACSETRAALDQWARQIAGGELHPCALCHPD